MMISGLQLEIKIAKVKAILGSNTYSINSDVGASEKNWTPSQQKLVKEIDSEPGMESLTILNVAKISDISMISKLQDLKYIYLVCNKQQIKKLNSFC